MAGTVWFAPWIAGAADRPAAGRPALVNLTEFTAGRPWDAVPVALAGLSLRRTWPRTEGAVGMWLWTGANPVRPRSGSVSVWDGERSLHRFVARPDHRETVEAHRGLGTLRSAGWWTERFDQDAALDAARRILTGRAPWPG